MALPRVRNLSLMDINTSIYYASNARKLATQYTCTNNALEERVFSAFARSHKILDIGCGTGRDLAFLLKMGKNAYGVDPSSEMLEVARETLKANGISADERLIKGALPGLKEFGESEFDGILCSAVLMHLPDEQIFDAVYALRRLLRPGGTLVVSTPDKRNDIDPITQRDSCGRLFSDLPAAKLHLLFERVGFVVRMSETFEDSLGREGITWNISEFRLQESANRPLHLVESILSRDKKDATYKLALFRALAEIAQTQHHLASFTREGGVKIPVQAIADKWILYYWPIFESEVFICQRTGERKGATNGVAIRRPLEALIMHFRSSGGMSAFHAGLQSGKLSSVAQQLWKHARSKFQSTIHSMPVRHAGGGNYTVFQYDSQDRSVCMGSELWRELCLTGSWIQDATLLRWAELTEQLSNGAVRASTVIDCLLKMPDPERNVTDARGYFSKIENRVCVWSGASLGQNRFDIDHAMPFSLWRNNELWNLFPTSPGINNKKSDKLPTYDMLHRRRDAIIECWRGFNDIMGEQFRREARTLLGRDSFAPVNWENRLFARFVEAFEITAAQRGVPRWEIEFEYSSGLEQVTKKAIEVHPVVPISATATDDNQTLKDEPKFVKFSEIGKGAFKTHLPLVGSLAAGDPFHGFQTSSLDDVFDLDWIAVPERLARERRFIVRVAGDSMEPMLKIGDLVVFEYHRKPRANAKIVIANLPKFGLGDSEVEAIKKISETEKSWVFSSLNPAYDDIAIPKIDTEFPILGVFVEKLKFAE